MDALIELDPIPTPDEGGRYEPFRQDVDITVCLSVAGVAIERRSWDSIIGSADDVVLANGIRFGDEDYMVLDDLGWDQMLNYGLIPKTWVPPR